MKADRTFTLMAAIFGGVGLIMLVVAAWLFLDGFEVGDLSRWSTNAP